MTFIQQPMSKAALKIRIKIMSTLRSNCFALLLGLASLPVSALETIKVYSYHLKPPLITSEVARTGLYYDAVHYFNKKSTQFHYELQYLPRRRLDLMVSSGALDGIVIGVSPVWFGDRNEIKYLWTSTLLSDVDEVVSNRKKPFEYSTPESLAGLRVGLVRGYYYFGVSEMADAAKLIRDDASSEDLNFRKLLADRIDVAIISRSNYDYVMKHDPDLVGQFYTSKKPHDQYDRRILVPLKYSRVYTDLNRIMLHINDDPVWNAILRNYR
jgi:polar amino acid transport system substrate-binding protein